MIMRSPLDDKALAGNWTLEPEQSSVRFTGRTLWGLVPVTGRFTEVTGEARITPDGKLSGRLVIQADSVRTGIGMRDRHLRAADFFDVAEHPQIVVDVRRVRDELSSSVTIRGITLPVPLETTIERQGENLRISARSKVDRTRWGVGGNMLGMMPPIAELKADTVFVR